MKFVGTQFSPQKRVFRETIFQDKLKFQKVEDVEVTFVEKIKVIFIPWQQVRTRAEEPVDLGCGNRKQRTQDAESCLEDAALACKAV